MWPDEDYSYPLPDVSQYSEKERRKLTVKGIRFMVFGERRDDVMRDVEHNRFLWYHGRRLSALRKERMKPFIKELVDEVRYGPKSWWMRSAMVRCSMAHSCIAWSWGGSVACGSIFLILSWPMRMAASVSNHGWIFASVCWNILWRKAITYPMSKACM